MTIEKQQENTKHSIIEKCFDEISKLPEEQQLKIAMMIHGAAIATEYYTNKNKASA